jgi:hypothetical protein
MGEMRSAYTFLGGKPEGTRPLGRPMRRMEDNIKIYIRYVGFGGVDRIYLDNDRNQ